ATEAPEVKRGGVPEITRSFPEAEVLGMALDVCDDAVDVHVADLEQNAHGLREAILLTPLQELRTGQRGDIGVAAAVDGCHTPTACLPDLFSSRSPTSRSSSRTAR